jgi:hypothetical protein
MAWFLGPDAALDLRTIASRGVKSPSARIYAPTSEHERDGNDKQDADGNRQNLDGVKVWSVTV